MGTKRVLITGAGGFVGSHVLRHLLVNTDWYLICLDSFRHRGKTSRIRYQLKDYPTSRITVVSHDLKVPIDPQLANFIGGVDYILNLASESHVDRSIEDPRGFIENNVSLMLTMLEYARKYPVEKFIQISTDEVYGPAPKGYKHKEGEPHRPSNPYAASKSAQEDIAFAYWRTFDIPIIQTNTMNIIGELQDPEKFVPMTIKKILSGDTVHIHASADGKQIGSRFYLHARNQADALLFILNSVPIVKYGEGDMVRINVVGELEISNLDLAEMIADFMLRPVIYELEDFHSSRPGHDLRYALDGTKLASLGWRAPYPLSDSLKQTVEWTLANREWL